jgi:hypothetical protein
MKNINALINSRAGIALDIGCGGKKADPTFVGMDVRPHPEVDIVHNLEKFPWPLPDNCCYLVHASHILEHISPSGTDPKLVGLIDLLVKKKVVTKREVDTWIGEYNLFSNFIRLMDEVWRVTRMGGKFHFVVPYGTSDGYQQDPTHVNPITETTLEYFDPYKASGLWHFYRPKPWSIELSAWQSNGFLEVLLKKIEIPDHA